MGHIQLLEEGNGGLLSPRVLARATQGETHWRAPPSCLPVLACLITLPRSHHPFLQTGSQRWVKTKSTPWNSLEAGHPSSPINLPDSCALSWPVAQVTAVCSSALKPAPSRLSGAGLSACFSWQEEIEHCPQSQPVGRPG